MDLYPANPFLSIDQKSSLEAPVQEMKQTTELSTLPVLEKNCG